MKIVLRSASPRRKELLEKAGYKFDINVADIDETMDDNLSAYENVKRSGLLKATVNKEDFYGDILIGCDTIVVYDNVIYGKPKDEQDAFNTLKLLSGKTHQVMSGVGIVYKEKEYNFVCVSNVIFKELSDEDIKKIANTYIAWQNEDRYEDVQGYCKVASIDEIKEHDYILTPGRYVGIEEVEDDSEPFEEKMERLTNTLANQFRKSRELEEEIRKQLGGIGYEL